jgi:hypothetical protein
LLINTTYSLALVGFSDRAPIHSPFSKKMTSKNLLKSKSWPIESLPGLSSQQQAQLVECGISTTGKLLRNVRTPEQKLALANKLQLNVKYVNKWVALADLARVPSVGCQYCGLLLHAGVASPTQLAQIPVLRLHQQVLKLQVATMQRRDLCPGVEQVQTWIEEAKRL